MATTFLGFRAYSDALRPLNTSKKNGVIRAQAARDFSSATTSGLTSMGVGSNWA